jgi:hypothetical protein
MATTPDQAGGPAKAPPVDMKIKVDVKGGETDHVKIAVSPWEARVLPGADVSWDVDPGVDSIEITPKDASKWPFHGTPSKGKPGQPALAGRVRDDAPPNGRYSYNIRVDCGSRIIDIDPEIVIRDPMGPG